MDEKIDKIIELAGNHHRYQYITEVIIILLWINVNLLSVGLPYLENTSDVEYIKDGHLEKGSLDYDICEEGNYKVIKTYDYSWVIEQNIECDKVKTGLIGTLSFTGLMIGALSFSVISKFFGQKATLVAGTIIFILITTLNIFLNYFPFYLVCLIVSGISCNIICYGTLVVCEECCSSKLRSLFGSLTNLGYSLGGIVYILLFWGIGKWKIVFGIDAGFTFILLIFEIFLFQDSPRSRLHNDADEFFKILKGIAKFNGLLEEFNQKIELPEYKSLVLDVRLLSLKNEEDDLDIEEEINTKNKKPADKGNNEGEKKEEGNNIQPETISVVNSNRSEAEKEMVVKVVQNKNEVDKNNELLSPSIAPSTPQIVELSSIPNKQNDRDKEQGISSLHLSEKKRKPKKKHNILSLLIYPSLRWKFIAINLMWFISTGVYNGLTLGIKNLPGSIYVNGIILFIVESVSYFILSYSINIKIIGRKKTAIFFYFLSAILSFLMAFFPDEGTKTIVVYMFMKLSATIPQTEYYTYSLEVYPSTVRSIAFCFNGAFSNAGGVLVPMIMELIDRKLMYIIFAVLLAACGVAFFFMEETVGKPMVETIKEEEEEESGVKF